MKKKYTKIKNFKMMIPRSGAIPKREIKALWVKRQTINRYGKKYEYEMTVEDSLPGHPSTVFIRADDLKEMKMKLKKRFRH